MLLRAKHKGVTEAAGAAMGRAVASSLEYQSSWAQMEAINVAAEAKVAAATNFPATNEKLSLSSARHDC